MKNLLYILLANLLAISACEKLPNSDIEANRNSRDTGSNGNSGPEFSIIEATLDESLKTVKLSWESVPDELAPQFEIKIAVIGSDCNNDSDLGAFFLNRFKKNSILIPYGMLVEKGSEFVACLTAKIRLGTVDSTLRSKNNGQVSFKLSGVKPESQLKDTKITSGPNLLPFEKTTYKSHPLIRWEGPLAKGESFLLSIHSKNDCSGSSIKFYRSGLVSHEINLESEFDSQVDGIYYVCLFINTSAQPSGLLPAPQNGLLSYIIDNNPPLPGSFGDVTVVPLSPTSIQVSWQPAQDSVATVKDMAYIVLYSAYPYLETVADAEKYASQEPHSDNSELKKVISELSSGQLYYFNILAIDSAGNKALYKMVKSYSALEVPLTKINRDIGVGGSVGQQSLGNINSGTTAFKVAPNQYDVAYVGDVDTDDVFELYHSNLQASVPNDVSGQLNGNKQIIGQFDFTSDGKKIVYSMRDVNASGAFKLFANNYNSYIRDTISNTEKPLTNDGNLYYIGTGTYTFNLSADGQKVVYRALDTSGRTNIYAKNLATSQYASRLNYMSGFSGPNTGVRDFFITPDSKNVVFSQGTGTDKVDLYSASLEGALTVNSLTSGLGPYGLIYSGLTGFYPSHKGNKIVIAANQGSGYFSLWTTDTSSKVAKNISGTSYGAWSVSSGSAPLFTSDDSKVVYQRYENATLHLYSARTDGDGIYKLSSPISTGAVDYFAVANSGDKVAFTHNSSYYDGKFNDSLYVVNSDGSQAVKINQDFLVSGNYIYRDNNLIKFSEKGDQISFIAKTSSNVSDLFSRNLAENTTFKLSSVSSSGGSIVGYEYAGSNRIVYLAYDSYTGLNALYSCNLDGSGNIRLSSLNNSGSIKSFKVSSDALKVVFVGNDIMGGIDQIYSINLDGSGRSRLSKDNTGSVVSTPESYVITKDSKNVIFTVDTLGNGTNNIMAVKITGE